MMYWIGRCTRISLCVRNVCHKFYSFPSNQKLVLNQTFFRNSHSYSFSFSNEKKLLKWDKLTSDYELIYRMNRKRLWTFSYVFTYFLMIGTPIILAFPLLRKNRVLYKNNVDKEELMEEIAVSISNFRSKETIVYSVILIVFNASLYGICKRFPLRIYCNGERYVAIFPNGYFPLFHKLHYFDKASKAKNYMFFLPDMTFRLGNKNARLFLDNFRRPYDFSNMIDKPYFESETVH